MSDDTPHLAYTTETAVEHLRNARQIARDLGDVLRQRDLRLLSDTVYAIDDRVRRALVQIARGNIGSVRERD